MKDCERPVVFAMDGATDVALGVEKWVRQHWIDDFTLASHEEWRRHDREGYSRSMQNVRGRKVYVINSFAADDVVSALKPTATSRLRVKLKVPLGQADVPAGATGEAWWADGDRLEVRLRGADPFVMADAGLLRKHFHVLGETVDEKLWGTINFVHSLRDASCSDVTLVATHLPYMRQTEKDEPRAGIYTSYLATHLKAAGVKRLIAMDVHSREAVQNSCSAQDLRFDHLEARCLLAREVVKGIPPGGRVVVCAPDPGANKRNTPEFHAAVEKALGRRAGLAIAQKVRLGDTETETTTINEDDEFPIGSPARVAAYVIAPDDILATGSTFAGLERAVSNRGGILWAVCYSHGLFTGNAAENLERVPRLVGTKTVEPWRIAGTETFKKLRIVDVAPVFARAIRETHEDGSINDLLTELERAG